MSTQLWWLLDTRYQPRGCRPSMPCTSQRAPGRTAAIQALLTATQVDASALSARSAVRRTAGSGTSSLIRAGGTRLALTSKVFRLRAKLVRAPRRAAGRRARITERFCFNPADGTVHKGQRPGITAKPLI